MSVKQRFDYVMLKAKKDENGFLIDTPVVARVGMQEYTKSDGTIQREFRPRDEVFSWDSLESYKGKSITLGHVTVTPDNAKKVTVGNCSGSAFAEYAEGKVRCPVTIMDGKAIESAESKKTAELSVGYTVVEVHEPGWGSDISGDYILKRDMTDDFVIPSDWVEFDILQTQIRVNHVALVKSGRAGVAKLNLDGSEEIKYDEDDSEHKPKEPIMKKIRIDSIEVEVTEDVANHIAKLDGAIVTANAKADGLEAERDALQIKVDGIPAQIDEALKAEKARNDELVQIITVAQEAGIKCDGLDAKAIKVAYVKEVTGRDISEKNDEYIDVTFDFAKTSDKDALNRVKMDEGSGERNDAATEIIDAQSRFRK